MFEREELEKIKDALEVQAAGQPSPLLEKVVAALTPRCMEVDVALVICDINAIDNDDAENQAMALVHERFKDRSIRISNCYVSDDGDE